MNTLKICDLSFCETVNASQIQGGLSSESTTNLLDLLRNYIPTLQRKSSEETDDFIEEEYLDESEQNYVRRVLSKDGRKNSFSAIGNIDGVNYAFSSSRILN